MEVELLLLVPHGLEEVHHLPYATLHSPIFGTPHCATSRWCLPLVLVLLPDARRILVQVDVVELEDPGQSLLCECAVLRSSRFR